MRLYPHCLFVFLLLLANLCHSRRQNLLSLQYSFCNLGWKMRVVWNDFGLLVFFTTVMVMELEQSNSTAANSWQEESILQLTPRSLCKHHSHYHRKPTIWPLESGNLLAACYHGISFHRAPLSSCTVDNWWCRWGLTPVAPFFFFFTFIEVSLLTTWAQ